MEKLLNKLERKLGRFAIPNLMYYIIILYIVGFVLSLLPNNLYYQYLSLDVAAILHGQVWRVLTFIIQPPATSLLFVIFTLYLYYMIGRELEYAWGTFRFNLYFFTGVLLHVVAAFLTYAITGVSLNLGTGYLNLSLYFAYAAVYPNQQFYLFGIVPIKVKYLAWIEAVYFGWAILQAFLPSYGGSVSGIYYKANALAAFVSILNFLLFFLATRNARRFSPKEVKRRRTYQKAVQGGSGAQNAGKGARHRCVVCGRTELDDPNLEFRYCSKCNGNYEYCQDHLFTHEHVK
ncbi:MAG: hypothetical protein UHS49_00760 [Faecalimonas sp.]|nr:hypothetical protein [Faecalimonas sp.]